MYYTLYVLLTVDNNKSLVKGPGAAMSHALQHSSKVASGSLRGSGPCTDSRLHWIHICGGPCSCSLLGSNPDIKNWIIEIVLFLRLHTRKSTMQKLNKKKHTNPAIPEAGSRIIFAVPITVPITQPPGIFGSTWLEGRLGGGGSRHGQHAWAARMLTSNLKFSTSAPCPVCQVLAATPKQKVS